MPKGSREKDNAVAESVRQSEARSMQHEMRLEMRSLDPLVRAIFRPRWRRRHCRCRTFTRLLGELFPPSASRLLPVFPWLAAVCVAVHRSLAAAHRLAPGRRRSVAARATGSARLRLCVGDDDNRPNRWCVGARRSTHFSTGCRCSGSRTVFVFVCSAERSCVRGSDEHAPPRACVRKHLCEMVDASPNGRIRSLKSRFFPSLAVVASSRSLAHGRCTELCALGSPLIKLHSSCLSFDASFTFVRVSTKHFSSRRASALSSTCNQSFRQNYYFILELLPPRCT